jgi:hypothetical protein
MDVTRWRPIVAPDSPKACFTCVGVHLKNGSTADQGWTGREDSSSRLWRLARVLGTHAKQSPSTGHSAVGLRPGRETVSCTPRPHFTAPSCTLGNRVVGASDGPPFRQERRPTRICRTPGTGSGLLAEASTLRACRCLEIDEISEARTSSQSSHSRHGDMTDIVDQ